MPVIGREHLILGRMREMAIADRDFVARGGLYREKTTGRPQRRVRRRQKQQEKKTPLLLPKQFSTVEQRTMRPVNLTEGTPTPIA